MLDSAAQRRAAAEFWFDQMHHVKYGIGVANAAPYPTTPNRHYRTPIGGQTK